MLHHFSGDRLHDFEIDVEQVVAAHAGLARQARRDDHDVGVGAFGVVAGADDARVAAPHRARLEHVERDARRLLVRDVDDDDVRELFVGDSPGHRGAHVARAADHCHFAIHACLLNSTRTSFITKGTKEKNEGHETLF